jgi:hypothetical protein
MAAQQEWGNSMRTTSAIITAALFASTSAFAASVDITVRESAGIARTTYPTHAQVPLPQGALRDTANARLMLDGAEAFGEFTAEARWPDNSIKSLGVDFNASVQPLQTLTYHLEYGGDVKAAAPVSGRPITGAEVADGFQVSALKFGKTPSPLILSSAFRMEDIAKTGLNGFTITDDKGAVHDLTSASVTATLVKPGPIDAMVRYTGQTMLDGASVSFTVTAELPNTKNWGKYSASVDDPGRHVREIAFHSPLAFGAFPWEWDLGIGSWTYGAFSDPGDSMTLTQTVKLGADGWTIDTVTRGKAQTVETSGGNRPKRAEGWGHFQDAKEVIAFGFDNFGREPGVYTVSFDAHGQETFRFAPATPQSHHAMTIWQHYVVSPTPIGAVTTAASMVSPLVVAVGKGR